MSKFKMLGLWLLVLLLASIVQAQIDRQTGVISGVVTDNEGNPLPGVNVYAFGPALIGRISDITNVNGAYRLPALPPGTYTVVAELQGFKTVKRENVIVHLGMVVKINIEMEPSALQEEVTVTAASPTVDVQSNKVSNVLSSELLQKLPFGRSLTAIINAQPGAVSGIIHGGTGISNAYEIDGINVNDPTMNGMLVSLHYDTMEEVEVSTGGLPAQVGNSSGNFINVITKSGGNNFDGQVQAYYTGEKLARSLLTEEQLKSLGLGKPTPPLWSIDSAFTLGGPIIRDKLWFFSTVGYLGNERRSSFVPTTILGKFYDQVAQITNNYRAFLKLTTQLTKNIRFFTMFDFYFNDSPPSQGTTTTLEAATERPRDIRYTLTGNLSWIIDPNTILDLRGGFVDYTFPVVAYNQGPDRTQYVDSYTGYTWGAAIFLQEDWGRWTRQVSARLTRFQDNFLGGDHEILMGIEYQFNRDLHGYKRGANPMIWYYYNGNPYYYRGYYGLTGPHPTLGDGRLAFYYEAGDEFFRHYGEEERIGAFIQDSWTIKNRLTINFGVRYDGYRGYLPGGTKPPSWELPRKLGELILVPIYGFNPYDTLTWEGSDEVIGWHPITPRIGLSYDIFGDGKTAIKVSYGRYAEAMPIMYFHAPHPLNAGTFTFNWWDLNGNGKPDLPPIDAYGYQSGSAEQMKSEYFKSRFPRKVTAPYYNEFVVGINHELFKDFKVTLQYFYRNKKNPVDDVLYDPATDQFWYTYENSPAGWWVPFKTIIPAYGPCPATEVTVYFMSKSAPYNRQFTAFVNVPEAKRSYNALELTFDKRWSHGWSLGGSIVYSRVLGDNDDAYGSVWGYSGAYNNPNWFINRYGRSGSDRPLVIKLYGAFNLPFGFMGSFYYTHYDGAPWQRTVSVTPPTNWANANNVYIQSFTINVEPQGSRRGPGSDNLDIRLEKEFDLKIGKLGLAVDIFNFMGNVYYNLTYNPGGTWRPADINTDQGTFTPSSWYGRVSSVSATREFRLHLRFKF